MMFLIENIYLFIYIFLVPKERVALPPGRFFLLFGSRRHCPEVSQEVEGSLRVSSTDKMSGYFLTPAT